MIFWLIFWLWLSFGQVSWPLAVLRVILRVFVCVFFPTWSFIPLLSLHCTPFLVFVSTVSAVLCTHYHGPFRLFSVSSHFCKCYFQSLRFLSAVSTRIWPAFRFIAPIEGALFCNGGNTLGPVTILKGTFFSSTRSKSQSALILKLDSRKCTDCPLFDLFNLLAFM